MLKDESRITGERPAGSRKDFDGNKGKKEYILYVNSEGQSKRQTENIDKQSIHQEKSLICTKLISWVQKDESNSEVQNNWPTLDPSSLNLQIHMEDFSVTCWRQGGQQWWSERRPIDVVEPKSSDIYSLIEFKKYTEKVQEKKG